MDIDAKKRTELIPVFLKRAHFLLWFMVLPQLLLLLLNYRSWLLVGDDMSPEQVRMSLQLLTCQLVLLGAGAVLTTILMITRKPVNWLVCIPVIVAHAAYLWVFTRWVHDLLPPNVVLWILPEPLVLYHQYAFIMPAIFYAALLLACAEIKLHRTADVITSFLAMVGIPFVTFLLLQTGHWMFMRGVKTEFEVTVIMVFILTATTMTMLAFFRVLMYLYTWIRGYGKGRIVLAVFAGLAAPLGGLLLNIQIPFPYDFQSPGVYVLTIINGIVLLLPYRREKKHAVATWCLRVVMYPFTLYFFMVFLPFLPLSLLAMIAAGAGFLILAPTLLFAVHTRRLIDEWRLVRSQMGLTGGLLLLLVCTATLPALYTTRALMDRRALMNAVDYVYSPDPAANAAPAFPLGPAKRALHKLNRMKNGIYTPFLSEYYNRIVFNNMILPDYKMTHVYATLFGDTLDTDRAKSVFTGFLGTRSSARRAMQGRTTPPPRTVALTDVAVSNDTSNGIMRACVTLTLKNTHSANAEFVTTIDVPPGVLVSDYWLDVEGKQIPGRIFERKTAMWVYHMIRDVVRRDPGLLVYQDPATLKLNVFPFAPDQTRTTGFAFLFPQGADPVVHIGDREVRLVTDAETEPFAVTVNADDGTFVYLNQASLQRLGTVTREPILHLLLDVSKGTSAATDGWQDRIQGVLARFPRARTVVISKVNRRVVQTSSLHPATAEGIRAALGGIDGSQVPRIGGFCPERAIKHLLTIRTTGDACREIPVFVACPGADSELIRDNDLAPFASALPDHPVYYVAGSDNRFIRTDFRTGLSEQVDHPDAVANVIPISNDRGSAVALKDGPGALVTLPKDAGRIRVALDDADDKPVVDSVALADDSRYARGLRLWARQQHADRNPHQVDEALPGLVRDSREERILIPATSFIVVESDAQWKMLVQKEEQALAADHALEFDEHQESPAPPGWFLVPVVLILLWRRGRTATCRSDL